MESKRNDEPSEVQAMISKILATRKADCSTLSVETIVRILEAFQPLGNSTDTGTPHERIQEYIESLLFSGTDESASPIQRRNNWQCLRRLLGMIDEATASQSTAGTNQVVSSAVQVARPPIVDRPVVGEPVEENDSTVAVSTHMQAADLQAAHTDGRGSAASHATNEVDTGRSPQDHVSATKPPPNVGPLPAVPMMSGNKDTLTAGVTETPNVSAGKAPMDVLPAANDTAVQHPRIDSQVAVGTVDDSNSKDSSTNGRNPQLSLPTSRPTSLASSYSSLVSDLPARTTVTSSHNAKRKRGDQGPAPQEEQPTVRSPDAMDTSSDEGTPPRKSRHIDSQQRRQTGPGDTRKEDSQSQSALGLRETSTLTVSSAYQQHRNQTVHRPHETGNTSVSLQNDQQVTNSHRAIGELSDTSNLHRSPVPLSGATGVQRQDVDTLSPLNTNRATGYGAMATNVILTRTLPEVSSQVNLRSQQERAPRNVAASSTIAVSPSAEAYRHEAVPDRSVRKGDAGDDYSYKTTGRPLHQQQHESSSSINGSSEMARDSISGPSVQSKSLAQHHLRSTTESPPSLPRNRPPKKKKGLESRLYSIKIHPKSVNQGPAFINAKADTRMAGKHLFYSGALYERPQVTLKIHQKNNVKSVDVMRRFLEWDPYWQVFGQAQVGRTCAVISRSGFDGAKDVKGVNTAMKLVSKFDKDLVPSRDLLAQVHIGKPMETRASPSTPVLLLRMLPVNFNKSKNRADCHLWPRGTFLQVDGDIVRLTQRLQQDKFEDQWKGPCKLADLGPFVRSRTHTLHIEMACFDTEPYYWCLAMCSYVPPNVLYSRILNPNAAEAIWHMPRQECIQYAKEYLRANALTVDSDNDDDDSDRRFSFSLMCPMSKQLIKHPVRGHNCKHYQVRISNKLVMLI
jgi:hypothetical protein